MARYKDKRNYVDASINTSTLLINDTHKAEGVNRIEVEMVDDEVTVVKAADGLGHFNVNPSREADMVVELSESSTTNRTLWDLWKGGGSFKVAHTNTAKPEYNCSGIFRIIDKWFDGEWWHAQFLRICFAQFLAQTTGSQDKNKPMFLDRFDKNFNTR